ncbi:tripartite tricarboxylate transporter substrate binding protein [Bordetella sp. BOR01]|uniref:Bug family tripartite tricarboxylate transporter substrate binding protein n=1 Tax=Bordetella sp. BOR01 TaxID=2854779 RepID=UPI001C488971|nr:tripartite tricarboxylate transporter substrate binding protein [Bordetella sp. BOR01]MBV7484090.1 tripartite tricarboxylate transporter substrate binding protein [Bordetella sp. BOR01]
MKRRNFVAVLAAMAATGIVGPARAQPARWPDKPVKMIVPFPAGGATDIIARILAEKLTQEFGQTFVVENRAGASGLIGQAAAARAVPDGYTVLLTGNGPHAINPSLFEPMPYDPLQDFAQISLTSVLPLILNVHPSVPAKTLPEFVEWIKENPGKFNYASPGIGSPPNLTMELFKSQNGLDIVHVPYKGSSAAITDLIGGQVSVMFDNALASFQHIKSGKIRAIGVGAGQRLASLPQVPTFKEAGYPDFEAYTWTALVAPAGVPAEVVDRLADATAKVLTAPDVQASLSAQGAIAASSTPAELEERTRTEIARWSKVIELAHIARIKL